MKKTLDSEESGLGVGQPLSGDWVGIGWKVVSDCLLFSCFVNAHCIITNTTTISLFSSFS